MARHPLPWLLLAGLAVVVVVHRIAFREGPPPAEPVPAARAEPSPEPARTETPAGPAAGPVRAFDDFGLGVHLRYPAHWRDLLVADLPEGPPGRVLAAVGPPGADAALIVQHIGPLVPRAGVEMIAERSAELARRDVSQTEVIPFARGQALRIVSRGQGRVEEARFFNHRQSLLAVRLIADEDDAETFETLRDLVGRGLRFD